MFGVFFVTLSRDSNIVYIVVWCGILWYVAVWCGILCVVRYVAVCGMWCVITLLVTLCSKLSIHIHEYIPSFL
jgi:hypothetical protein